MIPTCTVRCYVGGGDRGRCSARCADRPVAGAGGRRADRHHGDVHLLCARADVVGGFPDAVRLGTEHGRADHLHGAGDARVSVDLRIRHARTIGRQDRDGPASGVRRWRARTVPADPVSRAGLGDRDLDVPGQPRGDQQHLVPKSQAHRRHLRGHNRRQRTRTPIGATADDAAGAGVVGVVAPVVRPGSRPGRSCASIPFPGTATRSSATAADGISHRRRRGSPDRSAAPTRHSAGVGAYRRSRRTTPPGIRATSSAGADGTRALASGTATLGGRAPISRLSLPADRPGWPAQGSAQPAPWPAQDQYGGFSPPH